VGSADEPVEMGSKAESNGRRSEGVGRGLSRSEGGRAGPKEVERGRTGRQGRMVKTGRTESNGSDRVKRLKKAEPTDQMSDE